MIVAAKLELIYKIAKTKRCAPLRRKKCGLWLRSYSCPALQRGQFGPGLASIAKRERVPYLD